LRGGASSVADLRDRLARDGSWSIFAAQGVLFERLARSVRNSQVRTATVGALRAAGGSILPSPGPPHHCDLWGLTAEQFDAILGDPVPNPVPKEARWAPR
jgi:hypothetical protein